MQGQHLWKARTWERLQLHRALTLRLALFLVSDAQAVHQPEDSSGRKEPDSPSAPGAHQGSSVHRMESPRINQQDLNAQIH